MRFLSVCSGIEAASVAWAPLGWQAAAVAEIEPFPCHVLAHRHNASRPMHMPDPDAPGLSEKDRRGWAAAIKAVSRLPEYRAGLLPNFGNLEAFKEWPDATLDVLVGGTPCQSFSVAGLRKGLDDPRGNLALTYLAVAARYRPRWLVWENVPGVLSSNGGRDFGAFLGALGKLGYGWAYRVLDAQYVRTRSFPGAVPQRRRRVFVVGCLGDWRRVAAVLFDRESLSGNPPPRREAGQGIAGTIAARTRGGGGPGTDFECDGGVILSHNPACTLTAREYKSALPEADLSTVVGYFLRAESFDAGEDGTGRQTLVPVAFDCKGSAPQSDDSGVTPTLRAMGHAGSHANAGGQLAVATSYAVRRLTPIECERLQGFPDGYTDVPYRRRDQTPDRPRYKALGNSMAVNVMQWIGERVAFVEGMFPKC